MRATLDFCDVKIFLVIKILCYNCNYQKEVNRDCRSYYLLSRVHAKLITDIKKKAFFTFLHYFVSKYVYTIKYTIQYFNDIL